MNDDRAANRVAAVLPFVRHKFKLAGADAGVVTFQFAQDLRGKCGATQHFAAELFKLSAGVNMLHVPFRTSPEAVTALLGKQVDVLFDTVPALIGQVQSGKLKVLAVTGKDRFPAVPDVPTVIESGVVPDYDVTSWYGVFGPSGMPAAVVAKLNKTLIEIIADKAVAESLTRAGVAVQGSTPEAFGRFMAREYTRWNKVREAAGIPQQ